MIGARPLHQQACALETALRTASGAETAQLEALAPRPCTTSSLCLDRLLDDTPRAAVQAYARGDRMRRSGAAGEPA